MISQKDSNFQTFTIIIGAGAAGLSAAARLLSHNISDFIILEAESRIGGRVYSKEFGAEGAFVELGAEWCHGDVDNAVYDIVRGRDLLAVTNSYVDIALSNGSWFDRTHTQDLLNIFDEIYTPDGNKGVPEGITVGDYFKKLYYDTVHAKYKDDQEKVRLSLLATETLHKLVLTSEGSFSWFNTSATNDYRDCPGELLLNWKGKGYKQFFEIMLDKFKIPTIKNKILLNKEIIRIDWTDSNNRGENVKTTTVHCADGSEFKAKHVIVTCSLGVLKNKAKILFEPKLPANKMEAIENLGFEGVIKVMIEFEKKWWPLAFTGVVFAWNEKDKETISKEFTEGPAEQGKHSWLLDMMGALTVENNPKVLSCWFLGNMVPAIESISDEVIEKGIVYLLNKFVGRKFKLTKSIGIQRMNWYTNSNFHGVYTFQTAKSRKSLISSNLILGEPLYDHRNTPVVCFSGEATHSKYYSSVHGAVESGYREADRIKEFYEDNNIIVKYMQNKL